MASKADHSAKPVKAGEKQAPAAAKKAAPAHKAAAKDTRFQPGQSGNPAGRKPGSGWVGTARQELQKHWDGGDGKGGIQEKLIAMAKDGDIAAIRIVAERCVPALKPEERAAPIELEDSDTLEEMGMSILEAVTEGQISPGYASQLLQGMAAVSTMRAVDLMEQRIAALEAERGAR